MFWGIDRPIPGASRSTQDRFPLRIYRDRRNNQPKIRAGVFGLICALNYQCARVRNRGATGRRKVRVQKNHICGCRRGGFGLDGAGCQHPRVPSIVCLDLHCQASPGVKHGNRSPAPCRCLHAGGDLPHVTGQDFNLLSQCLEVGLRKQLNLQPVRIGSRWQAQPKLRGERSGGRQHR